MFSNRAVRFACLVGILVLSLLRLSRPSADPPLNLTTSGVLYTDEGQYSRNAARWIETGQWYTPGDFNPAIVYPLATAVQVVTFKALGLSTASARAITVLFAWLVLYLTYRLCRTYVSAVSALAAVALLAASYRFFAYSRIALLDVPMIALALSSLTLAVEGARRISWVRVALSAFAFMACWWTKLGVYFLPIVIYALWRDSGGGTRAAALMAGWIGICVALFAAYYFLLALPYYTDYQYLMGDVLGRVRPGLLPMARNTAAAIYHAFQADPLLAIAVVGAGALLVIRNPSFRSSPLLALAALWTLCRIASLGTTPYQPPRYFLPIHVSLAMATACVLEHLRWPQDGWTGRPLFGLLLLLALLFNLSAVVSYVGHPRFTFTAMCADIKLKAVTQPEQDRPVLMGNIADSISLATGIPAVNDRLGTADLTARVRLYRPTYYLSLGPVEPHVAHVLARCGDLALISRYDVYDNYYTGQPVYLYALRPR